MSPFPIPETYTITITKTDGPVGIRSKSTEVGSPTLISGFSDTSPLLESPLEVGQVILSVNGTVVESAKHCSSLIKEVSSGESLTIVTCSAPSEPYYKLVVAPSSKETPGVVFTSTREGCLVRVSRVFEDGPFASTGLMPFDIVLAVNGVCVSKLAQADQALSLSQSKDETVLYCLDVGLFRKTLFDKVKEDLGADVAFVKMENKPGYYSVVVDGSKKADIRFNFETLYMEDPNVSKNLRARPVSSGKATSLELMYVASYGKIVVPFMKKFNVALDEALYALEEVVGCEAWAQAASIAEGGF